MLEYQVQPYSLISGAVPVFLSPFTLLYDIPSAGVAVLMMSLTALPSLLSVVISYCSADDVTHCIVIIAFCCYWLYCYHYFLLLLVTVAFFSSLR